MTDMSTHMEHDQSNLLADLGQMPGRGRHGERQAASASASIWRSPSWSSSCSRPILAPWLPLKDPEKSYVVAGERPPYSPSWQFWFGTDQLSRDMFSRCIWGARISLTVGFEAIAFGMLVGGSFGMIAGYFRGRFNAVISFVFVILLSFPALVLAILITSLLDRSLFTISFTIGILSVAPVGMVSRATTISFADREFVLAARIARRQSTRGSSCASCCPTSSSR